MKNNNSFQPFEGSYRYPQDYQYYPNIESVFDFYENTIFALCNAYLSSDYKNVSEAAAHFNDVFDELINRPLEFENESQFFYLLASYIELYFLEEYRRRYDNYAYPYSNYEHYNVHLFTNISVLLKAGSDANYFDVKEALNFYAKEKCPSFFTEETYEKALSVYRDLIEKHEFQFDKIEYDFKINCLFMLAEFFKSKDFLPSQPAGAEDDDYYKAGSLGKVLTIIEQSKNDEKFLWKNIDNFLINKFYLRTVNYHQIIRNQNFDKLFNKVKAEKEESKKYLKRESELKNEFLPTCIDSLDFCLQLIEFYNKGYYSSDYKKLCDSIKLFVLSEKADEEKAKELFKYMRSLFYEKEIKFGKSTSLFSSDENKQNPLYGKIAEFPGLVACSSYLIQFLSEDSFKSFFPMPWTVSKIDINALYSMYDEPTSLNWFETSAYDSMYLHEMSPSGSDSSVRTEQYREYILASLYFALWNLCARYEPGIFIDKDEWDEKNEKLIDKRLPVLFAFYEGVKTDSWCNAENVAEKFNNMAVLCKFVNESPLCKIDLEKIPLKYLQRIVFMLWHFDEKNFARHELHLMTKLSDIQKEVLDCEPNKYRHRKSEKVEEKNEDVKFNRDELKKIDNGFIVYIPLSAMGLNQDAAPFRKIVCKMFFNAEKIFAPALVDKENYQMAENYEYSNNLNLRNHYLYMAERNTAEHDDGNLVVESVMKTDNHNLIPALIGIEQYLKELPSELPESWDKNPQSLRFFKNRLEQYFKAINLVLKSEDTLSFDEVHRLYNDNNKIDSLDYEKDLGEDLLASLRSFLTVMYNANLQCVYEYPLQTSLYLSYLLIKLGNKKEEKELKVTEFVIPPSSKERFEKGIIAAKESHKNITYIGGAPWDSEKEFFLVILMWQFMAIVNLELEQEKYKKFEVLINSREAEILSKKYFVLDTTEYGCFFTAYKNEYKPIEWWDDVPTRYIASYYNGKKDEVPTYIRNMDNVESDFDFYNKLKDLSPKLSNEFKEEYEKILAQMADDFFDKLYEKLNQKYWAERDTLEVEYNEGAQKEYDRKWRELKAEKENAEKLLQEKIENCDVPDLLVQLFFERKEMYDKYDNKEHKLQIEQNESWQQKEDAMHKLWEEYLSLLKEKYLGEINKKQKDVENSIAELEKKYKEKQTKNFLEERVQEIQVITLKKVFASLKISYDSRNDLNERLPSVSFGNDFLFFNSSELDSYILESNFAGLKDKNLEIPFYPNEDGETRNFMAKDGIPEIGMELVDKNGFEQIVFYTFYDVIDIRISLCLNNKKAQLELYASERDSTSKPFKVLPSVLKNIKEYNFPDFFMELRRHQIQIALESSGEKVNGKR